MRVMKFGGTSVGTVESLRNVKKIVESTTGEVVVVVSALGGVTDMLIRGAGEALTSRLPESLATLSLIEQRHRDVVFSDLVPSSRQAALWEEIDRHLTLLRDYYTGISLLQDLSERTLCKVVSLGERMSCRIVTAIISGAQLFYSPDFIKTESRQGKNIADAPLTSRLIAETFAEMPCRVAVAPGFISTDRDTGDITNLGRGGSDFTAALIAAALGAEVLDIWTDVDGFMTADPRIISEAIVIPHLSFLESMDLCNFGAKVIYPPTIYPVFHKNIPIRILNTFNPTAPGTLITDEHRSATTHLFRGVTSIAETSLLRLTPAPGTDPSTLHTRVLNVLSKQGVEVLLSTLEEAEGLQIAVRSAEALRAGQALRDDFAGDVSDGTAPVITTCGDVSAISAVGENIKLHPDMATRLLACLNRAQIPLLTSTTGASGFVYTLIVPRDLHHAALRAIHSLI